MSSRSEIVSRARHRGLALVLVLVFSQPIQEVLAQPSAPRVASATATLSVLAGSVQRVPAGGGQPQAATDGMDLAVGDRILTGPKATALITFLDGSTVTVQPESEVAVKKAEVGGKASTISIQINFGKVWARVVRLADPKSSFSLESNTATATVHDGLIGGMHSELGFHCWTRAGGLTVTDNQGRTIVVLIPGEDIIIKDPSQEPVPKRFWTTLSALKVTVSAGALPLVLVANNTLAAGFVAPGVEINQVFGSFTGVEADGTLIVEVPTGDPAPLTLALEGLRDGPYKVTVTGLYQGDQVYQRELAGTIKKGERVVTEITQQIDPATSENPKTAKVQSGRVAPFQTFKGPLPGKFLLSPTELQDAGGGAR